MKIMKLKPNHVCCNPNCKKGEDGGRKKYFACDYCDRINSWKSICCSLDCYNEFISLGRKRPHNRLDKTEAEMKSLMNQPEGDVKARTIEELEASGVDTSNGIGAAVEQVNEEIESENERRKKVRTRDKEVDPE